MDKLNGLVLAGGQSQRMGSSKGRLVYSDLPQQVLVYNLLVSLVAKTILSVKSAEANPEGLPALLDDNRDIGPAGGLLAAHAHDPEAAWLVLGCDYPLLTVSDLRHLIRARKTDSPVTAFVNSDGMPEPLLAIWEPRGLELLLGSVKRGKYSPRKLLERTGYHPVTPPSQARLQSIDTPAEYRKVLDQLKKNK